MFSVSHTGLIVWIRLDTPGLCEHCFFLYHKVFKSKWRNCYFTAPNMSKKTLLVQSLLAYRWYLTLINPTNLVCFLFINLIWWCLAKKRSGCRFCCCSLSIVTSDSMKLWSEEVLGPRLFKGSWDTGSDTIETMGYCTCAVKTGLYSRKCSIDGVVY